MPFYKSPENGAWFKIVRINGTMITGSILDTPEETAKKEGLLDEFANTRKENPGQVDALQIMTRGKLMVAFGDYRNIFYRVPAEQVAEKAREETIDMIRRESPEFTIYTTMYDFIGTIMENRKTSNT